MYICRFRLRPFYIISVTTPALVPMQVIWPVHKVGLANSALDVHARVGVNWKPLRYICLSGRSLIFIEKVFYIWTLLVERLAIHIAGEYGYPGWAIARGVHRVEPSRLGSATSWPQLELGSARAWLASSARFSQQLGPGRSKIELSLPVQHFHKHLDCTFKLVGDFLGGAYKSSTSAWKILQQHKWCWPLPVIIQFSYKNGVAIHY